MRLIAACLLCLVFGVLAGCATPVNSDQKVETESQLMHREAQAAYDQGDDARAEQVYKKLTTLGPQDAETWFRLGNLYARTGKPQIAQEAYLKSLSLKDTDPRTWNNLGIVMLRQAWLALVQSKLISEPNDPAFENTAVIIKTLETLPAIASEKKK